jgi:hypothetical protein
MFAQNNLVNGAQELVEGAPSGHNARASGHNARQPFVDVGNLRSLIQRNQNGDILIDINKPGMDGYELAQRAIQMRNNLTRSLSEREGHGRGSPLIRKPFCRTISKRHGATYRSLLRTSLLARSALQWLPPRALVS